MQRRWAWAGLVLHEYSPALVKRTVVGRGAAEKKQVAMVVSALLQLGELPRADAADALAIAVTHLQAAGFHSAVRAATGPVIGPVSGRGGKRSTMSAALRARLRGTT